MTPGLMRLYQNGQSYFLEGFQQAFRRRMRRRPLRIARIQSAQRRTFLGQLPPHHKLKPRQDAQGERQQANQTCGMIVALDIHGRARQGFALQTSKVALYQILVAIGLHCLGQREPVCRVVRGVHPPAPLLTGIRQVVCLHSKRGRSLAYYHSPTISLSGGRLKKSHKNELK
jgi:hypothetical protein